VQLGTVLFSDPLAPLRIVRELTELLQQFTEQTGDERWADIQNFVGALQTSCPVCHAPRP